MPDPQLRPGPLDRGADGGPLYAETPAEIRAHAEFSGSVAEPWNAATAFLFVLIVAFWAVRLRGRIVHFPFLALSLPLLLVGGFGGTLYHGLRSWKGYFLMDVIPIYLLGLIVTIYWWIRLGPRLRDLLAMLVVLGILQLLGVWQLPTAWAINLSYAMLAMLILAPLSVVLIRTRGRHAGWVATALVSFAIGWFCRIADYWDPPLLPMGTHWLWHTFGALTTAALTEYVFLIEGVNLRKPAPPHSPTPG
jgi:hypothetical protein